MRFKLGDLGLAIKSDEELPFTRSGTLDYMAPEVRIKRSQHVAAVAKFQELAKPTSEAKLYHEVHPSCHIEWSQ